MDWNWSGKKKEKAGGRRTALGADLMTAFAVGLTVFAVGLFTAIPANAAEKTEISRVTLEIDADVGLTEGEGHVTVTPTGTSADLYRVEDVEVSNDDGEGFGIYDPPELVITLSAGPENTVFSSTSSRAFRLSLSEDSKNRYDSVKFVRARREDEKRTMVLTVRLLFDEDEDADGIGAPFSACWDPEQPGRARWSQVTGAKYYQIQLIHDHKNAGDMLSIYGDGYDFSEQMTENGTYWFQVRSVKRTTNEKSDWITSEPVVVTGEENAVSAQGEQGPGAQHSGKEEAEAAGDWQQAADGVRWWWRNPDGSWPANQWMKVDGIWYYFDEEGYLEHQQEA